jgi:fermentation-respiration switch protein FrsA (DUF1100 family)
LRTNGTRTPHEAVWTFRLRIDKIACPVLTVSARDDRFGTASRATSIAASVLHGKAIIFPTGGHALVGHSADALRAITSFLRTLQ